MKKNINELLANVTNISVCKYGVTDENGVFANAFGLVTMPSKPEAVTLYNFNLLNGKTEVKRINLAFAHCNVAKLIDDFKLYWYYLAGKAFDEKWKAFADVVEGDLTDEEKAVFACVKKRRAHIIQILKPFTDAKAAKVCSTVSDMVKAVYGCKEDVFSKAVQDAFGSVKAEINSLNNAVVEDETKLPNLKNLRISLNNLTHALWRESSICEKWIFNANAALTADVYRVAYEGRKLNKNGEYVRVMAKGKKVLCEVIFACIEALQKKAGNAIPETTTK